MAGTATELKTFTLHVLSSRSRRGWLRLGQRQWPCSLGKHGIRARKREGDGATPRGIWRMIAVRYRRDRSLPPATGLATQPLHPHDGWCDAPHDRNYNRPIRHPYPASAERMWRADRLYDVVVILDHNARPRIKGAGSAIFMHLERPDVGPTAGCIALSARDLRQVLQCAGSKARVAMLA